MNLIDSHASCKICSCKLNTVAWVIELTYLDVIVECESLLGGHGEACCNVKVLKISREVGKCNSRLKFQNIISDHKT